MSLSTFVTLSRFNEGKEIRIVRNPMLNVATTLQHNSRRHNRHQHNSHFRPYHNVVTTLTTTLRQHCQNFAVPAGT